MAKRNSLSLQPQPELDVDALDEKQLNDLKESMAEPPKEEPPEPEKKAEAPAEPPKPELDDDGLPVSESVPYSRFHQATQRRRDAERKASELAEKHARLEERTNALLQVFQASQQQQQARQQPPEPPPQKDDPLAYLDYMDNRSARLEQALEGLRQNQAQQYRQQQEEQYWRRAYQQYNADLMRFQRDKPDLQNAINFLADSRRQELSRFGVTDPVAQQDDLATMERQVIQYAIQNRMSPAEIFYSVAQDRGYRLPEAPVAQTPAKAPAAPKPADVIKQVMTREKTRQDATSLSGSGAPAVGQGEIGPTEILEMSEEEFSAFKKKYGDRAMSKAFGLLN